MVRKRGQVLAVEGISFDVEAGTVFGLLGPNGAGKTSTIEVLEGLDEPTSGSVRVLGLDIRTQKTAIKERIGVQLQMTGLPRYLRVGETLSLFHSLYGSHAAPSIEKTVARLGLNDLIKRLNSKLSGGERQRVALALALVNDPELLFLDEPSSGLDPHGRQELWSIIREWKSNDKTVFLTTHDMAEAEALCDQIGIMDQGRLVAVGTVRELMTRAESEAGLWVEAGSVWDEAAVARMPGLTRWLRDETGVLIYTLEPMDTIAALLDLRSKGVVTFHSFELRPPSLEDVFLSTTGRRFS